MLELILLVLGNIGLTVIIWFGLIFFCLTLSDSPDWLQIMFLCILFFISFLCSLYFTGVLVI